MEKKRREGGKHRQKKKGLSQQGKINWVYCLSEGRYEHFKKGFEGGWESQKKFFEGRKRKYY